MNSQTTKTQISAAQLALIAAHFVGKGYGNQEAIEMAMQLFKEASIYLHKHPYERVRVD